MNEQRKGFRYIYSKEKADQYQKLSPQQRLEWLEHMNHFLFYFMPKERKEFQAKLRRGEI